MVGDIHNLAFPQLSYIVACHLEIWFCLRDSDFSVLRDKNGSWIGGFARNMGSCNVLMTELTGIGEGLVMAWDLNIRKLCIESDSAVGAELVEGPLIHTHHFATVIHEIKMWLQKDWQVRLIHNYREGNAVADWIATFAHSLPVGLHSFQSAPRGMVYLIWADFVGICLPCRVAV